MIDDCTSDRDIEIMWAFFHKTRKVWLPMTIEDLRHKLPGVSMTLICRAGLVKMTDTKGCRIYTITEKGKRELGVKP